MKKYIITSDDVKAIEEEFNINLSFDKDDELIRCKDCAANADTVPPCPLIIKPGPEGYCSFAVRKENE